MRTSIFAIIYSVLISSIAFASGSVSGSVSGHVAVEILPSEGRHELVRTSVLQQFVRQNIDVDSYRGVKAQVILNENGHPDHILVHLQVPNTHRIKFASIHLNEDFVAIQTEYNYQLNSDDLQQQKRILATSCPDNTIEFIAFAPNTDALEQQITKDVAQSARDHGLKTVELLLTDATRQNYLNYMACPKLKGNFYDGDADPTVFTTVDGVISATEVKSLHFNYHVTNIWLACEAFNDPMLSSVTKSAQSQKYAAGINDLLVGPSDKTAKCAMIAALDGQPMTQAFQDCYKTNDDPSDKWGFAGDGSDLFGH